ncbi:ExbD/TolR family protein [Aromatoleum bremense]|uniref:Biopolymer transporter ExbD n=1 Tax=Aromatoleum bremense TaxID=76115 RepID=A0ABX1P0M6_9RHOO|nr:biopolymer transporter ExbD [Aromatoleum bremense]NMG17826.1 biopolymer transporter ExbD [Aromatoleum bremense]QTQ32507.1 Biopolymer transport protein [Aromatoleum bremense]
MAFGGFSQEGRGAPMSEINMVPLIDVMLVLLIVFMITAPLLTHAVKIDLPNAASAAANEKPETVTLAIDEAGTLYWNDRRISDAELQARFAEAAANPVQPELHLRADRETRYQKLAEVMSAARLAGIQKMGFVTVPEN